MSPTAQEDLWFRLALCPGVGASELPRNVRESLDLYRQRLQSLDLLHTMLSVDDYVCTNPASKALQVMARSSLTRPIRDFATQCSAYAFSGHRRKSAHQSSTRTGIRHLDRMIFEHLWLANTECPTILICSLLMSTRRGGLQTTWMVGWLSHMQISGLQVIGM